MTMSSWATKEVEIACAAERVTSKTPDSEWDYGCFCYESALKAFLSLMNDRHSGMSIQFTQEILNRLIDGKPLTPIENKPDIWDEVCVQKGKEIIYQCNRMSSLFKYVYPDGTVKYSDMYSYRCIDVDEGYSYSGGIARRVVEEMFPITLPYYPTDPIKVYCQDILTDTKNGEYDTVGVLYAIKHDGSRIEINRFFKEGDEDWVEITKEEYEERKSLETKRKQGESLKISSEAEMGEGG